MRDAVFAEADRAGIEVGPRGDELPDPLLQESGEQMTESAGTSAVRSPKPTQIVEAQT
jgi:mannose-6-phosphate isomerase